MSLFDRLQGKAKETLDTEITKGRAFLEENKKRPGVTETASGLQYEVNYRRSAAISQLLQ
jgi:FKBP-type peptidyl-prolyl cis-trans isomerase